MGVDGDEGRGGVSVDQVIIALVGDLVVQFSQELVGREGNGQDFGLSGSFSVGNSRSNVRLLFFSREDLWIPALVDHENNSLT